MKIKTLKAMGFDGKHTPVGTVVECSNTLARELIASNRAVAVGDETPADVETKTEGAKTFLEGEEDDDKPAKSTKLKPAK